MMEVVGRVDAIWRYPVKSLLGERLESAAVGEHGIAGDRRYALSDAAVGSVLSGKRVPQLFTMRARTADAAVEVVFADGRVLPVGRAAAAAASEVVEREVVFAEASAATTPEIEAVGDASSYEGTPRTFDGLEGTFFDSSPLHLLTDATLAALGALAPDATFDARRFRPNLVVAATGDGFIEDTWIGREIGVGSVVLEVRKACSRCVMTTLPQSDLGHEREVLRTAARHNDNHVGVLAVVLQPGRVEVGDELTLR